MPSGAAHQAEFHGKPEEARHGAHDAGEAADALRIVADARGDLRGGDGAFAETHQGIGELPVGVHGDVAGDVVEDVRFRQVVHVVGGTDGDGGGKLAAAQAIEEEECRGRSR